MGIECAYSFTDLFVAAYRRRPREDEIRQFFALSQAEKNRTVSKWAHEAGWQTREKTGSDGLIYLAFAPKF